ncbi:hypothetical protein ASG01_14465 [Chryseobacterium sp. Leaf180]|uniref:MalY/PatB family protein n=1 Tax=Chryseobacterium sp. Leaf180 TaxID=1736289 RepID=UPI0006F6DD90|nr:PatB family C-S lyase [Chryseobacterium sp. Leaf180]KQR91086.1 hypothetical protein ASG01_14465 [Chryseobacterium sp. Leaf180]
MDFNFDEEITERSEDSLKWNSAGKNVLPMWVAEMDFRLPEFLKEELIRKISAGSFGYFKLSEEFFKAVQFWLQSHHQLDVEKDFILPVPGVMSAVSAIINTFTESGDQIIIQPPVYNHFFNTIKNSEREIVENELILNGNQYEIDFKDLETKASDPKAKILLICNPQNPIGKVWRRETLEKIAAICEKNDVMLISDEIHADLSFKKYTPFYSVATDFNIEFFTVHSPCKAFNFPGLPIGYVLSNDNLQFSAIEKMLESRENISVNTLSVTALVASYNHGEKWLDKVKNYIHANYLFLNNFIKNHLPQIGVLPLEATYLVWLDCRKLNLNSDEITEKLLKNHHLLLNSGSMYGKSGDGFLRINIACTRKNLETGLSQLREFVNDLS